MYEHKIIDICRSKNEALKSAWSMEVKSIYSEREKMKENKISI
jgi:hypothetical protein